MQIGAAAGYWTICVYANLQIGQLADWATRGCLRQLCVHIFRSFGHLSRPRVVQSATCPVHELAYPQVVQLPFYPAAHCQSVRLARDTHEWRRITGVSGHTDAQVHRRRLSKCLQASSCKALSYIVCYQSISFACFICSLQAPCGPETTPPPSFTHSLPTSSTRLLLFTFSFSYSLYPFSYFSIPSVSIRIGPLRFQAGRHRRRLNLGLVFCVICIFSSRCMLVFHCIWFSFCLVVW